MTRPVLSIEGLTVRIGGHPVVDGVTCHVDEGEILAVVGESGCGKSMTAFSVMGLLPAAASVTSGQVRLGEIDLLAVAEADRRRLLGTDVAMIFQEPVASLNPLMRIGGQIAECLRVHRHLSRPAAEKATIAMLEDVGVPEPAMRCRQFPFELSGGTCQRVMIAMALICRPRLLIADEPTTALDVTIQAQILELMKKLRNETGTSILLITHDMGVVADMADRVAVMYGGRVVEEAPVDALFARQWHPYTRLLLATIPRLDSPPKALLPTIEGVVPDLRHWPAGCRFSTRCPLAEPRCHEAAPPLAPRPDCGQAACWRSAEVNNSG